MPRYHKEPDTLEKIVAEAIERERQINEAHPERHGYGMTQEEARDLIRRIENLEIKLLHSQKEKIRNREQRIRLIGRDKLYTHSPEDLLIEKEERRPIQESIQSTLDKFTKRREKIFSLHEQGHKNVEIAEMMGISRFIVGREIKIAEQELKKQLTEDGYNGTPLGT